MKHSTIFSAASVAAMCALLIGCLYVGCSGDEEEEGYDELITTRADETMPQVAENYSSSGDPQTSHLSNIPVKVIVHDDANNVHISLECYFSGNKTVKTDDLENGGSISTVTVTSASLSVKSTSGTSNGVQYSNASATLGNSSSISANEDYCVFNVNASAKYTKTVTYSNGKKKVVSGTAVKNGAITISISK